MLVIKESDQGIGRVAVGLLWKSGRGPGGSDDYKRDGDQLRSLCNSGGR